MKKRLGEPKVFVGCPTCGRLASPRTAICPHCEEPLSDERRARALAADPLRKREIEENEKLLVELERKNRWEEKAAMAEFIFGRLLYHGWPILLLIVIYFFYR